MKFPYGPRTRPGQEWHGGRIRRSDQRYLSAAVRKFVSSVQAGVGFVSDLRNREESAPAARRDVPFTVERPDLQGSRAQTGSSQNAGIHA